MTLMPLPSIWSRRSFQYAAGDDWIEYHRLIRNRFETEIGSIPIAQRAFRLRRLGQLHDLAFEAGKGPEAAAYLEQAAKEVGDVYTNIKSPGGGIHGYAAAPAFSPPKMTAEEAHNMIVDRLKEAIALRPRQLPAPS